MNKLRLIISTFTLLVIFLNGFAQPGAEIDLTKDKPKKYENRRLRSEKTGEKKLSFPGKVYQNTVTHYNYYFNANQRLNDVVAAAKASFRDDYTQLLPFYNYSLQTTSQNKSELDSVIYKATAGILLHDLRNSWIDNLYLILGKAYLFRNDLDSAALTFQYLNFAFAPKEGGGYDIPIGSNESNDKGEFSIVSKEKNSIFTKLTSRPPSRNESFIWQARTFIERNELPEAAGLIEILRHDPNFPKRLQPDLEEVLAYWYYKQQVNDSAAHHLALAMSNAENAPDKARREFLIAQLYQLSKNNAEAVKYYNKAIDHATDPIMDVYARLNSIRINKGDKKDVLQQNIDELHKMARKSKYEGYRDIIYYASASIELERKNIKAAKEDLLKSVKYTSNNPAQRSQSFLLLADMSYDNRNWVDAANFYDSIDVNSLAVQADKDRVGARKVPLRTIADNLVTIAREDSLQALAALPAAQRDAIVKKQEKALRKAQGLKEEEPSKFVASSGGAATDLFVDNSKGDFYFYNAGMKGKGFSDFKAKWGDRPNVDNWRRKQAVDRMVKNIGDVDDVADTPKDSSKESKPTDNSYEGLQANIPLTPEKMEASNKSIADALFGNGSAFEIKLEEYHIAIDAFEELLKRFPNTPYKDSAMFQLVYLYGKVGDNAKADMYKTKLLASPESKWSKLLNAAAKGGNKTKEISPATKKYEEIYNMFIEGNFEQAKNEKVVADSMYGSSYWTPQLLFIEAIYYIRQPDNNPSQQIDTTTAMSSDSLHQPDSLHQTGAMTRAQNDSIAIQKLTTLSTAFPSSPMAEKAKAMIDVLRRRKEIESYLTNLSITRKTDDAPVAITPSTPVYTPRRADTTPASSAVADTSVKGGAVTMADTTKAAAPVVMKNFRYLATDSQYVVLLLDKVDKVYINEAQNAFNRFNKEKFYSQTINISSQQIDDRYTVVLQGPFSDAGAAIDYIDKAKPQARSRIVPWLAAEKYSFLIISEANLTTLKSSKDIDAYKQLLQQAVPGKF